MVIHRVPVMLERDWRRECLALDGKTPPDEPAYNLLRPRSACPGCKAPDHGAAEHSRLSWPGAARQVQQLQPPDRRCAIRWWNC